MLKSIFKEIIIVLLLLIILVLLLGILFYQYFPSSQVLPSKVQEYALDEDIKLELEEELKNADSDEIIKTYQVDAMDLDFYQKTNEYNKGKINPFAQYSSGTTNNDENNETNTNSSGDNTTNNSSNGNFLNSPGK